MFNTRVRRSRSAFDAQAATYDTGTEGEHARALYSGGTLVIGDAWRSAPARALMNAWTPRSREGDVRIYSEAGLRAILGAWFESVEWHRVGLTACLAAACKGR